MCTKSQKADAADKKGMVAIPAGMLTLLVAAGLIVLVYIIGIQNYFDVKVMVKEFQAERHTIDFAQAMINSEKLVYSDGARYYRAIFDRQKLDSTLKKGDLTFIDFLSSNTKLENVAYPNSIAYFIIEDLETDEVWSSAVWGPQSFDVSVVNKFVTCMANSAELNFDSKLISSVMAAAIAQNPFLLFLSAWSVWDLGKCANEFGEYAENVWAAVSQVTQRGFPVAINSGDETHVGKVTVQVIEW